MRGVNYAYIEMDQERWQEESQTTRSKGKAGWLELGPDLSRNTEFHPGKKAGQK